MASISTGSSDTAFNKLPFELNKNIALMLESDRDIANFSAICRVTHDAIYGDELSFWRKRFEQKYSYKKEASNRSMMMKYQGRVSLLNRGLTQKFNYGTTRAERKIIWAIRDMIKDSFQGETALDEDFRPVDPNQVQLIKFIKSSKYFLSIRYFGRVNTDDEHYEQDCEDLAAVRIMGAQLLFHDNTTGFDILSFDDSQYHVYSEIKLTQLFFRRRSALTVNMDWVLHCLSFFRHHMTKPEAATLYSVMNDEDDVWDKVSAWRTQLHEGCRPLSENWRGTYSYIEPHELNALRKNKGRNGLTFEDKHVEDGDNAIQVMNFKFIEPDAQPWPDYYERRLNSLCDTMPHPPRTRAQQRTLKSLEEDFTPLRFHGKGVDQGDVFRTSGWLNSLAPQGGIDGWQRVTFMKHYRDIDEAETDDLWAYEGVVLPGGRIMVGRWWYGSQALDHPQYSKNSGPWIMWAVDNDIKGEIRYAEEMEEDDN